MSSPRMLVAAISLCMLAALALGQAGATSAPASSKETLLFDFEPGSAMTCEGMNALESVAEHATQGTHAGKAVLKGKSVPLFWMFNNGQNAGGHWGEYDRFMMDVFVEGGSVKASGLIRDDQGSNWPDRYNFDFVLPAGKRQIEIPIGSIIREQGHKPLNLDKLTNFAITFESADADKPATVYLDNARLVKGTAPFSAKVMFSFEGNDAATYVLEDWPEEFKGKSQATVVAEHATDGQKALSLQSQSPSGNVQFTSPIQDWSGYDTLAIDVFNPSDKPQEVGGWIKAAPSETWNQRCNWSQVVRPGKSTIKLPVGGMSNGANKPFSASHVEMFNIGLANATLFIDNIRLVKGVEEVQVDGIKKFDFGPATSAVMPGFTPTSSANVYDKAKGYGWLAGGTFMRDFDVREVMNRHIACDSLCRDACTPTQATFAVDVPNGEYRVWVMMSPPGGLIWTRTFKHRTVAVQGKTVEDMQFDAESYRKYEFQWEDAEDLPGDDLWERYIDSVYKPILVDASVTDGQIKVSFDSHDEPFGAMVCGLVVWPKSQETPAQKWLVNLEDARKEQYAATHVEKAAPAPEPLKPSDADQAKGFVRFIHSPDRNINPNSVPTAQEIAATRIELFAAPGEYEDGCIGLYPFKDAGTAKIVVSDLTGPGGAKIPASAVDVQVSRYKSVNHGATYTSEPRYLDKLPAEGVATKAGVTRSIWLIVHVPDAAKAGEYEGQVKLTIGGQADAIDMALTVWPIKLCDPEMPLGMFGVYPPYYYLDLATNRDAYWKEWKNVLEDSHAHGMNSADPAIGMPLKEIKDGKAVIDFTNMDKWMEMAKAAGFNREIMVYAGGLGFDMRPDAIENGKQGGAENFGLKTYAEMVKLYFDAFKQHAQEKGYLPMSFCINDEYLVHGGTPEQFAKFGQIFKDNAPGIHFVPVDSMYPDENPATIPALEKMLKSLDTWGAGLHSPKVAEMVKASGSRLWLYNTGLNRFTFGTYMFYANKKWDVKGFTQWIYASDGSLSHYDMAGYIEASYGVVIASSHGMRPTVTWERLRAGCDDHRYLQTAWELIAKAKADGKGSEQAKALEATIEQTFAKLSFGKVSGVDAASGEGKADNPMNPAQMEAFRKAVAEGIVKLQAAR